MYNSVRLSTRDQHTRRFLWRNFDTSVSPDHYTLTCVPFGDRPSAAIAIIAFRKTAELLEEDYPKVADVIKNSSYVDDILTSESSVENAFQLARDIDHVLGNGGFRIKHWIISGNHDKTVNGIKLLNTDTEKVLGLVWRPQEDIFTFKVLLNFTEKGKQMDSTANISSSNVADLSNMNMLLTKRMVLKQVAGVYDPLGMVVPYILTAKSLMRSLCQETSNSNGNWDEPLSLEMKQSWFEFFKGLFELELLEIPRCIQPNIAYGKPMLVLFSDGSNLAFGACAYIRWETAWNTFFAKLLMAKNRIAPTRQLTIPRLELCGAVLSARLREKIVNCLGFSFDKIIHLVDSAIVRAQIQKESYGFGTFVANRVAEIQTKTPKSDWYWIPSDHNLADFTTRITPPSLINNDSVWQKGPEFLYQPFEKWPIKENVEVKEIPDALIQNVQIKMTGESEKTLSVANIIDLNRISTLSKLLRITGLLQLIGKKRTFRGIAHCLTADDLRKAETTWIKHAQEDLPDDALYRFRRLGPFRTSDGIITVGQRMNKWIENNWNPTSFALIPARHPLAEFIVKAVHDRDHAGIDVTLAKIRSQFWIPKVKNIISRVKSKCVICRKKFKVTEAQQMGQIPVIRLKPAPPFYYCAVDLFGPLVIRDTVKKRTHGKGYGVLFNCLVSRAVYIDLAEGYDVGSFMMVLRRFVSLRGYPRKMISDAGTQLVAAGKELKAIVHSWEWDNIKKFGKQEGMDWETTKSADAPWENWCSEALIKSTKICMESAIGTSVMTFSELQTVLFEVGNLLNERPIGTKNCDPVEGTYLCPNDLLLGRASSRVPVGNWNTCSDPRIRWKFVQRIIDTFWKRWTRDYFHTLIIRQKWHTQNRNVQVGDVVLVQDSNTIRGQWKLAQICEAIPGMDGRVRDVKIRYKNISAGRNYRGCQDSTLCRSVRRLVVVLPIEEQK